MPDASIQPFPKTKRRKTKRESKIGTAVTVTNRNPRTNGSMLPDTAMPRKTKSQRSNPKYGGLGGAKKVGKKRTPYRPPVDKPKTKRPRRTPGRALPTY